MKSKSSAEFMLSIFNLKVSVKFPCKMGLQHDGKSISTEVEPINGIFTFNQDVTIKINHK